MEIYFVKHGKTPSASQMRLSFDDEPLSDEGKSEAKQAADDLLRQLGDQRPVYIISSPRRRTLETAMVIATTLGQSTAKIEIDNRLAERDCTPYLGSLIADVFTKSEEVLVAGGMESLEDLYSRTRSLYDDINEKHADKTVLLVGHSGNLPIFFLVASDMQLGDVIEVSLLPSNEVLRLK